MSRHLLRVPPIFTILPCSYASASAAVDHYAVLGLAPGASAKDIKAAYYKLSKQHHPDTNPDNKEEAAKKFHEVVQAYEVLSSDEQRKIYDMTRIRTSPDLSFGARRHTTGPAMSAKNYTDVDIDYKSFEQFQRSTRRRRQYHSHFDMPNEFYAEFGGKKRVFKSEYEENTDGLHSMYRDSRAAQREMAEMEREIEREKIRQQEKYPIPTFEQMMIEKRQKEQAEQRKYFAGLLSFSTLAMLLFVLMR